MEIYYWQEKNKDYFAIQGDTDDFFIEVVEHEMILNEQKESADWITFWVAPHYASIITKKYPVQYQKPVTDIEQFQKEAAKGFEETEKNLEKEFGEKWGGIQPLNADLKNINKQAEKMLREHVIASKNNPRQSDNESSIPSGGNFVYKEEDFE